MLVFLSSILFGPDSGVTEFIGGAVSTVDLKFSREQETTADQFGLELLHKKYGHAAGATDFFQRISEKRNLPQFLEFISSHPMGEQRVEALNKSIRRLDYAIGSKIPLEDIYTQPTQEDGESEEQQGE